MLVLALEESPSHVSARYRINAFMPALSAVGLQVAVEPLKRRGLARLVQFSRAGGYDAVVLQRRMMPAWQLRYLRRKAKRLVFDFDDAIMYRDSYHRRGIVSRRLARRFAATVSAADCVIAGNNYLRESAIRAGVTAGKVVTIPTCVDPQRYPLAAHDSAGALALVWIGSHSTLQGLELQRQLWDRMAREVAGISMRVICDKFPHFDAMPVVAVAWREESEAAELAAAGAGISWMPDDLWSRGKCGLKVLQYHAAGLPVIANPVGTHREMIEAGVTGYLAESAEEWIDAARKLALDPEMRRRLGRAARARVESHYSVSAWAPKLISAIAG